MRLSAVGLIATFSIGLLLPPLGVAASQPVKVHRIGVLMFTSSPVAIEELRQGLHEVGYVEGRNLTLEVRSAEGRAERLADLAAGSCVSRWTSLWRIPQQGCWQPGTPPRRSQLLRRS